MEKDKLFNILNDWNYWDKETPHTFARETYQKTIETYEKAEEIIILKGVRRSGKSTLLLNHIKSLLKKGVKNKEILIINFEDSRFINDLNTKLLEDLFETYQEYVNNNTKPHIFLDEIQNIKGWETWVRTMYELGKAHLYITGSSSKLLSKEFGTALSGRYLGIDVLPLSFKEYLTFKNKNPNKTNIITKKINYKKEFNNYNKEGGFPKLANIETTLKRKELGSYYESIILKDIVARNQLKNQDNVKKVALYLLSNIGKPINLNTIKTTVNISYALIENYYEYLKDAYLIFEIQSFSYSIKKQLSNRKIYCIDNGILDTVSFNFSENYGRYLENTVYLELLRRNQDIYYHKGKKECDFIIKEKKKIISAIQVSKTIQNPETRKREIEGLLEAMEEHHLTTGLILTEDEEETITTEEKQIIVKPVWKWLLEE